MDRSREASRGLGETTSAKAGGRARAGRTALLASACVAALASAAAASDLVVTQLVPHNVVDVSWPVPGATPTELAWQATTPGSGMYSTAIGPDGMLYEPSYYTTDPDLAITRCYPNGGVDCSFLMPLGLGTGGIDAALCFHPAGTLFGPDGLLYVSFDTPSTSIVKIDVNTLKYWWVMKAGACANGATPLFRPGYMAFAHDGTLYVSDYGRGSIETFGVGPAPVLGSGTLQGLYLGACQPAFTFSGPENLVFAPDGTLFVDDYLAPPSGAIYRINSSCAAPVLFDATLTDPHGLAIGPDGLLYVGVRGTLTANIVTFPIPVYPGLPGPSSLFATVTDVIDLAFRPGPVPEPGEIFCDGSAGCPVLLAYGNGTPEHGCSNSAFQSLPHAAGAKLTAYGSLYPDRLVFSCVGVPNNTTAVLSVSAFPKPPTPFVGGLDCLGPPVRRLALATSSNFSFCVPTYGSPSITARHAAVGDPVVFGSGWRYYQVYYRDPNASSAGFSAAIGNMTNGYKIYW